MKSTHTNRVLMVASVLLSGFSRFVFTESKLQHICDDEKNASSHSHFVLLFYLVRKAGGALHADGSNQQTDATQEDGGDHEPRAP